MLIKFRAIPSIEKLNNLIKESKGNVYLELPNKAFLDLRKEQNLYNLLDKEVKENHSVSIHVFDKDDYFRFVNYMI